MDDKKAQEFLNEANKKAAKKGGFMSKVFGGGSGAEEAIELYEKAGNCFKMAKKWKEAGDAFVSAGNLQNDSGVKHEAASKYVDAANCYRKSVANDAVKYLLKAIEIYTEIGKFSIAAKHHMTIAEIYEEDVGNFKNAIEHYEKAADYYAGEQSNSQANKCRVKVAEFCMQLEEFEKAMEIFEEIGKKSMENKLLMYGAKDHFFKSILCHLSLDAVNAQKTIQKYEDSYPIFTDSREYKLVKSLIEAVTKEDVNAYVKAIENHETISRLEPKIVTVLLKIRKQNFKDEPETGAAGAGSIDENEIN